MKTKEFKNLLFLVFTSLLLLLSGCKEKDSTAPGKIHWDRDMCERCKMAVSDRKFATEIVDPKTKKHYYFDDIGCAVLWLEEEKIPWRDEAIIWVKDAKSGEWLDAKKAIYYDEGLTPMAYGILAYSKSTFPKGKKSIDFQKACEIIRKIENRNNQRQGISQ